MMPLTSANQHDEERDLGLDALVSIIWGETEMLHDTLKEALARQWEPSPAPRSRVDVGPTDSQGRPADPTVEIALDARRLAVRESVEGAREALFGTAARLRAARLLIERAVARFDGEGGQAS